MTRAKPGTAKRSGSRWKTPKGGAAAPIKGGDGGVLPKVESGWKHNGRDVLAGESIRGTAGWAAFEATLIETADPDDWAHRCHEPEADAAGRVITSGRERLLTADELPVGEDGGRPGRARRYPPSQLVGRPGAEVGVDSMFDHAAAVAGRLQAAGIELGWRTRATGKELRWLMCRAIDVAPERTRDTVRSLLEPVTTQRMDADELRQEIAGDALLSLHGFRMDGRPLAANSEGADDD